MGTGEEKAIDSRWAEMECNSHPEVPLGRGSVLLLQKGNALNATAFLVESCPTKALAILHSTGRRAQGCVFILVCGSQGFLLTPWDRVPGSRLWFMPGRKDQRLFAQCLRHFPLGAAGILQLSHYKPSKVINAFLLPFQQLPLPQRKHNI